MNPAKPTEGWNQITTLPRRLTLDDKDRMVVEPAGDVESLRGEHQRIDATTLAANKEIVLEGIEGNAMEIVAEIDPRGAPMVEMDVLRSPNREESTRIAFFQERGYRDRTRRGRHHSLFTIDSSHSSVIPDVRSRATASACRSAPKVRTPN